VARFVKYNEPVDHWSGYKQDAITLNVSSLLTDRLGTFTLSLFRLAISRSPLRLAQKPSLWLPAGEILQAAPGWNLGESIGTGSMSNRTTRRRRLTNWKRRTEEATADPNSTMIALGKLQGADRGESTRARGLVNATERTLTLSVSDTTSSFESNTKVGSTALPLLGCGYYPLSSKWEPFGLAELDSHRG